MAPFSSGANPDPQINLLQVRDITIISAPIITSVAVKGLTLTFTATNGPANGPFVLLQSDSLALPRTQWAPVFTNSFDGNGSVNLSTNVVSPANPRQFYILQTQQ